MIGLKWRRVVARWSGNQLEISFTCVATELQMSRCFRLGESISLLAYCTHLEEITLTLNFFHLHLGVASFEIVYILQLASQNLAWWCPHLFANHRACLSFWWDVRNPARLDNKHCERCLRVPSVPWNTLDMTRLARTMRLSTPSTVSLNHTII